MLLWLQSAVPAGQPLQAPQSAGQFMHVSPIVAEQTPSPQRNAMSGVTSALARSGTPLPPTAAASKAAPALAQPTAVSAPRMQTRNHATTKRTIPLFEAGGKMSSRVRSRGD